MTNPTQGEGVEPSARSGLRGPAGLRIVEGIAGVWHYHLSESGATGYPTLCGTDQVMHTMIPFANWMDKRPSHLPSSYCKACDEVLKARSARASSPGPSSPSSPRTTPVTPTETP